ncbi:MAG TPA: dienelactone hydrolase family protein [Tepidisphaeraceae bacterium]|nr:dienelactone hydrolase family protein [Tepidisphaeraceae bacterium]
MKNPNLLQSAAFTLLLVLCCASSLRADAPATPQQTRDAFLKLIDRPKVELAPELKEEANEGDLLRYHFSYASEAGQRVPGILLMKPEMARDGARHPVVIVLHGTGGKKEGEIGYLKRLAEKGFIAIAIDGRFHGERGTYADYNAAIAKAYNDGASHPFYYDTVWDVLRLIDYLDTRPDVDPHRIGLTGISKGGIETWLAAAVDERVACAVPCIGVQSFQWGLDHDGWHARIGTVKKAFDAAAKSEGVDKPDATFVAKFYDRVVPGIHGTFDGPAMLPLIAPRPLLVISGEKDPNNPLPGVRLCDQAAKEAYAKAGTPEKYEWLLEANAGHTVTPEAQTRLVDWFVKWIGNEKK